MVNDRHKGRHRSMLWNSNVIRNDNQSLWWCLFCSAAMSEWLVRGFIKDDVFADENISCCWIPQSPCLGTCCIANHDTFGGV